MDSYMFDVLLIAALVVLNGYFAASEIALVSARRAALQQRAEEGSAGAQAAIELNEDPSRLLATIQIGITLVGFMASATAAVSLSQPLAEWLASVGGEWLARIAPGLSIFLVTVLIAYATLVFGELAPKRLGLQRAEAVAIRVARPINFLATILKPFVWFLAKSTDLAARLLGVKGDGSRPGVTEEEIKLLVTEQGSLLEEEKRMIHEIFELGDTVAREIMTPRVDIVMLEKDATVAESLETMQRSGYSRMPIFDEDPDTIVGNVLLKDLVNPAADGKLDDPVLEYARQPTFTPETKRIIALLSEMQARRSHQVIVVDEYGGTAGLVTIEDIVEEIIGEVADEFDRDRRHITDVGENEWVVDGRLPVEDAIEMGLPVEDSEEYETLAGWLLAKMGHIPIPGERLAEDGFEFSVQAVRRRRVVRIHVKQTYQPDDDETATDA
jgi:putative hemolysin